MSEPIYLADYSLSFVSDDRALELELTHYRCDECNALIHPDIIQHCRFCEAELCPHCADSTASHGHDVDECEKLEFERKYPMAAYGLSWSDFYKG